MIAFLSDEKKERAREREEGCSDNGSSSNEQRSLEHTIFSKLQCPFRFFLSLQLWQSLCNSRPLSPHDWTCSHVQRGHYGESRNLMHETFIHALTLHRPKHPSNIQYKAEYSVTIIMLKDITVHSVKYNWIMNSIMVNIIKLIEGCAVSWRYVVEVAEVFNILHDHIHIQGPKWPAIN